MLRRHEISDEQWEAIRDLVPGKEGDPGATAKDNRLFVNALRWIAKTGAPWRDLPTRFGNCALSTHARLNTTFCPGSSSTLYGL